MGRMSTQKIYTRSGDEGETSLYTGQRVSKNDPIIDAIGTVDELNSSVGCAIASLPEEENKIKTQLVIIQHALFDLGAALATPRTRAKSDKIEKTRFDDESITLLEKWMDQFSETLPPLKTFILPGGHPAGAALHLARSICRRAERTCIPLNQEHEVSDRVLKYLNRLSDYLFMASRFVNHALNQPETSWDQHHALHL